MSECRSGVPSVLTMMPGENDGLEFLRTVSGLLKPGDRGWGGQPDFLAGSHRERGGRGPASWLGRVDDGPWSGKA